MCSRNKLLHKLMDHKGHFKLMFAMYDNDYTMLRTSFFFHQRYFRIEHGSYFLQKIFVSTLIGRYRFSTIL